MIKTREELVNTAASVVAVSRDFAEELYKSTRNADLKELLAKSTKDVIVLKRDLIDRIKSRLTQLNNHADTIRGQRKGKGGRKALPEPTAEELEKYTPEQLLRYKNRKWKRDERRRKASSII